MTTGENIGRLAKERDISLRKLSVKADVPYTTLYSIVRRKSDKIDIDILKKIAGALDLHPIEVMGRDSADMVLYGMELLERAENITGRQEEFDFYIKGLSVRENALFNELAEYYRELNTSGMETVTNHAKIVAGNPAYRRTQDESSHESPDVPTEGETPPEGE